MSISKTIWEDQIRAAINKQPSMLAAAQSLGMSFGTFKYRAKQLKLYKPNQGRSGIPSNRIPTNRIPLAEILDGKYPNYGTNQLKKRLIRERVLLNVCDDCGLENIWNGKTITLQLDHINGIANDHRLCNLHILCPNCHSQTTTFSGKNANKTTLVTL